MFVLQWTQDGATVSLTTDSPDRIAWAIKQHDARLFRREGMDRVPVLEPRKVA